ncbi:putative Auxin-induced protein 5NG4 [Hibiscus syriacus]|uniref:Auxin-induced protein 5NG4 n=1 Tax=Hibiscus syriacus TaxID=106335 RepID=A0A6A3CD96_HIBSY|nr:pentatricopeptide repeat-containing protein At1g77360, mitochondrial-like [Hibiscus syriacus]XP_039058836.1 pentatricopeptide repeat-containing protein At1g77360, mitochondrial-like [Hibiscus syriacus]XP_039058837.1 pentatricopeptide repeat-containing protein At1g77360, mitochondrial-like [Hibiscus syriacus]KAE8725408.1 putative Auxin-induced protein 5NG4 [Hibiscus syriacus]
MEFIDENRNTKLSRKSQNQTLSIPNSLQPQRFPTHLDEPDISPTVRTLCDLLTNVSPHDIESALSASGIIPTSDIIQQVLSFSYNQPSSAVKFFRWAGRLVKPSACAWNLIVDLLGKNQSFEPMWDAMRSMKQEGLLSMSTFVSVFGSYCIAHRFSEATMSFDVMDRYGVEQDVVAVNSLLSAICSEDNQMPVAIEFFDKIKMKIPPDEDTFAILLEGWEREGNLAKARNTFGEMIVKVGWSRKNISSYDAFLTTLVRGSHVDEALRFLQVMKKNDCLPGLKFFSTTLDILVKQNDSTYVIPLWDTMVDGGLLPNLIMYNALIGLLCNNNDVHNAFRFLDEMVVHGAFPDSLTYNMIFHCLVRNKMVSEVGKFFVEMIKNEAPPISSNHAAAIKMLLGNDDPEMAIDMWNYMVDNCVSLSTFNESANELLIGLCNLGRLVEVKRFAETMLDRRIKIFDSTMDKLKDAFYKKGRSFRDKYDSLSREWKDMKS